MLKLCYVLPEFEKETDTHFRYLYLLLDKISSDSDIFLIIEKSTGKIEFFKNTTHVYVQKFRLLPLRILENFLVLLWARVNGYGKYYIHYSYISAINASLISKISFSKVWYWNCGMPWLFKKDVASQFLLRLSLLLVNYLVTGTNKIGVEYAMHYSLPIYKVKILSNWVDVKRFAVKSSKKSLRLKWKIPYKSTVALYVHRLSPRKGSDMIVPIAKMLKNVLILVVGDGPYRSRFEKEIFENKIDNIKYFHGVSNTRIPELMALSDIFIMPSREEGSPHVLIESMASGLPYVATDVGGVAEITPPILKNYLTPSGDIDCFVNNCNKLLKKCDLQMKNKIKEYSKTYNIDKIRNDFTELFY